MQNSLRMVVAFLVMAGVAFSAPAASTNKLSTLRKSDPVGKVGKLEQEVLTEMNLARQKPQEFAKYVEDHQRRYKDDNTYTVSGGISMTTQEGVKAVDEAIAFLKKLKPVGALEMSVGLSLAARDHVDDLGPKGQVGHNGTDGSDSGKRIKRYGEWETTMGENISFGHDDARMIVIQLIVDDGVPLRGHRTNIFQPKYKTVGIACGNHNTYRHMCVMDFAGGFKENRTARDAAKKSSR
jgi:uncharacterized protein YkwD